MHSFQVIEDQAKYYSDEKLEERAAGGRTKFQTLATNAVRFSSSYIMKA